MKPEKESLSAQTFQTNGFYESLTRLRESDPRAFATISPASKLALCEYERQKREHEQSLTLRDEPEAA